MKRTYQDLSTKEPRLGKMTLPVGFDCFVMASRIIGVCDPHTTNGRQLRMKAYLAQRLIDTTHGRKTRAILITDSNHVILSAVSCETLQGRLEVMGHES